MITRSTFITLAAFFLTACVTTYEGVTGLSDEPIVVSTLDLFAQNETPKGRKPWLGDWEFRRDRLEIVDAALRDLRADVVVFQNALRRTGSASEADDLILKSGSLARFEWQDVAIESLVESGEDRLLAVSVARPGNVQLASQSGDRSYWQLGVDGHVAMFLVSLRPNAEPVLVVNVLMPSRRDQVGLWYSFLKERVMERVSSKQVCSGRVIISGFLPEEQDSKRAAEFLTQLNLRDTAAGVCQNASRCQTATSANGIYSLTRGDEGFGQMDRILVHKSTEILNAGLVFTESRDSAYYRESYGLSKVWASQRYGWSARFRLPSCR